jgi:hypothetical protein
MKRYFFDEQCGFGICASRLGGAEMVILCRLWVATAGDLYNKLVSSMPGVPFIGMRISGINEKEMPTGWLVEQVIWNHQDKLYDVWLVDMHRPMDDTWKLTT